MKTRLTTIQIIGIVLLPVSMLIFHFVPQSRETMEGAPLINYLISILYFILSFIDKKENTNIFRMALPKINWHILLSLMFISCFTLNKDIHVFALTPLWVKTFIPIALLAYITSSYKGKTNKNAKNISSFVLGASLLFFLYYTLYLLPYTPFAIFGLILVGISIHLVIPLLILLTSITCSFNKDYNDNPKFILGGLSFSALLVIAYIGLFSHHTNKIKSGHKNIVLQKENPMPEWVTYAQSCKSYFWTKRIIGLGLYYEENKDSWLDFDFNTGSFSEIKEHDPLVCTASLFVKTPKMSNQEQVQILSAITNSRHYAYEKLWSGRDLEVNKSISDVRIYPEYRIAYMEKTIWITNNNRRNSSQQEALFTFQLPDGAVASSLSLWIDGKEEKSRLTTRKKATKAYKTIVGVESRDPVVLHWQEGNRLTATIFPCTPKEPRRVKIGVTIPLIKNDHELVFSNLTVKGPKNNNEEEVIHVKINGSSTGAKIPSFLKEELPNQYIYSGSVINNWSCSFATQPLSKSVFSFNGQSYKLKNIEYTNGSAPKAIYLDINKTWNTDEVRKILLKADQIPVYAFINAPVLLNISNMDMIFKKLSKMPFSIFPVYAIGDTENSILITKGAANSPIPSELKNSSFHNQLIKLLNHNMSPIPTLILDGEKSPYITALEQYKIINCQNITFKNLTTQKNNSWYNYPSLVANGVLLPMSDMAIVPAKNTPEDKDKAPSHLLRLYNYHKIIQKAGSLFLQKDADIPDEVYELCNEAFIATPVSSLIVLESEKDYKRFGIDKNKNSLKNANLQDSGAVPEPHEWALIIMLATIMIFIYLKFK